MIALAQEPEFRLMAAVLKDALRVILEAPGSPASRRGAVFSETIEWGLSDDPSWPFSFCNLCIALDVDPRRLRAAKARTFGRRAACRSAQRSTRTVCRLAREVLMPGEDAM